MTSSGDTTMFASSVENTISIFFGSWFMFHLIVTNCYIICLNFTDFSERVPSCVGKESDWQLYQQRDQAVLDTPLLHVVSARPIPHSSREWSTLPPGYP